MPKNRGVSWDVVMINDSFFEELHRSSNISYMFLRIRVQA